MISLNYMKGIFLAAIGITSLVMCTDSSRRGTEVSRLANQHHPHTYIKVRPVTIMT